MMQIDVIETAKGNRFRWCRQAHFGIDHEITSSILVPPTRSLRESLVVREADGEIVGSCFATEDGFEGKSRFGGGAPYLRADQFKPGWTIEVIPLDVKGYDVIELFDLHFGAALFGLEVFGNAPFYKKHEESEA